MWDRASCMAERYLGNRCGGFGSSALGSGSSQSATHNVTIRHGNVTSCWNSQRDPLILCDVVLGNYIALGLIENPDCLVSHITRRPNSRDCGAGGECCSVSVGRGHSIPSAIFLIVCEPDYCDRQKLCENLVAKCGSRTSHQILAGYAES
jgi:hypothetical protein